MKERKEKIIFAIRSVVSVLFIAMLIMIKSEPAHMIISILYVIYLVATAFEMIKKCDVLVKLLDEFGIWQNVAEKIAAENPSEKIPAKTSSQRFIWFAFHGYDFGDERIRAAKAEYKPYVVLFYGSLIVYIFTVLV